MTRLNLCGYAFCCTGVGIYNWQKLQQLKRKAQAKAKEAGSGGGGGDSESSTAPLLGGGGGGGGSSSSSPAGGKPEGSKE